ncbi:Two component regulator propeller [Tenacibaculum sp. 190524A02b]|uniref:Two component regulator propeller n=1 Tax=Tenacibaculum vairaonense TaxID=3137860 RepID=A0ABM9PL13_9FLAO
MKFLTYFLLCFAVCSSSLLTAQNIVGQHTVKEYTTQHFNKKEGLLSNTINGIVQDSVGYLWFASNKGVIRYDGNDFKLFGKKQQIQANYITKLYAIKDSLIIGSPNTLFIKSSNKLTSFDSKRVNCISKINNHIFIGTQKGIYRLREDFISPLRTNFQIDLTAINDIQFDGKFYWVATQKALWKIDDLLNPKKLKRIGTGNYTAILIDNNRVIATTLNNGIKVITSNMLKTITSSTQHIKGIKKIKNMFWIYSNTDGIEVLSNNFSFSKKINKYNIIRSNKITDIFQDHQQNIWIATNDNGIFKLKDQQPPTPYKPSISFEDIEVVYKTIDSINLNNYNKILQLPSDKNHIAFTYKSVDINNPKEVFYRYKLNDKYSPWSSNNTVNLANLKAGDYTFAVQSKVINQQESKPIQFQFYIDKPLYKKAWFQWTLAGILLSIIGLYAFNYLKRLKAKNAAKIEKLELENHLLTLEQKALQLQMNPHFIFNVLNGVKALGNSGKRKELNDTISKFSNLLRAILNTSRKDEVSLSEEINTLKNYIELEQQMSRLGFSYEINTELSFDTEEVLIPPMLIQPFVENSIKHGIKNKTDGKITLKFYNKKDFLHCEIIDNGVGINHAKKDSKTTKHDSLAITVTEERIKSLHPNSSLKLEELLESKMVKGTKVWFKIPLKTDF